MRHAHSPVRHRNRRILSNLKHRPATPAEISDAIDIAIDQARPGAGPGMATSRANG
jgi:hypothetical protein